eukprot:CAMPEP_0115011294 /NCGR_PEP_ID=MMETSP0216-20121206/23883_1 /TAXON_ID=223996 /ORGANISM="Protocruzia adherens, Strain Boccale" /LENGTH=56 /DNA_ID=CAMNT_0002379787 /DNA_START=470 /DNA_END=640 /DNA_ORIENTATION=+
MTNITIGVLFYLHNGILEFTLDESVGKIVFRRKNDSEGAETNIGNLILDPLNEPGA